MHTIRTLFLIGVALFTLSHAKAQQQGKVVFDLGRLHLALPDVYAKNAFTTYEGYVLSLVVDPKTFEPIAPAVVVSNNVANNIGITIQPADGLAPHDKLVQLYPRYLDLSKQLNLAENMISTPFRNKSPFESEILITDTLMSGHLIVFCPKFENPPLPKNCLAHFRFADVLDVQVRFVDKELYKAREYISQARALLSQWALSAKK